MHASDGSVLFRGTGSTAPVDPTAVHHLTAGRSGGEHRVCVCLVSCHIVRTCGQPAEISPGAAASNAWTPYSAVDSNGASA